MNTRMDASQQQKQTCYWKITEAKAVVNYFTDNWFIKENYWVIYELVCNS
jgi:hypothetical protein